MLSLAMMTLMGCSDRTIRRVGDNLAGAAPGEILGRVCDPSGRTWLADAIAYTHIIEDGQLVDTRVSYSDRDGYWLLDELPPEQEYTLYIQYGDEIVQEPEQIWVGVGDTIKLEEPDCFDPLELRVAVITGDYDDFQLVLQTMGFANYVLFDGKTTKGLTDECTELGCASNLREFLTDLDWMKQFDIIMFNGGHVEAGVIYDEDPDSPSGVPYTIMGNPGTYDPKTKKNVGQQPGTVQQYVEQGGTLYASDWSYDVVERGWPDRIDFLGDDEVPDDAQAGAMQLTHAAISDAALADWLGLEQDFVDIEYDLELWGPVESTTASVSGHLSGSVDILAGTGVGTLPSVPLLVSFNDGKGKVVYSTFRVAKNASTDMMLILQYMMYAL